ncbi:MAG: VOC family protein [Pirellulales bacterium]
MANISPTRVKQLNHVALHVADVERSIVFYSHVLCLEPMARPAFTFPGAWFRLGVDQELHLIGGRQKDVESHNRGNHFALAVEELDSWEAHLTQMNANFFPRKLRPDGAFQVFLIDPDGHYIELCTAPRAEG